MIKREQAPASCSVSMEIMAGVEESCLGRLLDDPLWMKYAVS